MKTSEILRKARGLIDAPEKWTTGRLWVPRFDEQGKHIGTCYCSIGALAEACGTFGNDRSERVGFGDMVTLLEQAARTIGNGLHGNVSFVSVGYFNDTHTHEEVMAMYGKAIADAEAKEAS